MSWKVEQNGWLEQAWRTRSVQPDLPAAIDPVPFLLESRFPATHASAPSEEPAETHFVSRLSAIFELAGVIIQRLCPAASPEDQSTMVLLALSATLGEKQAVDALHGTNGQKAEATEALERHLANRKEHEVVGDLGSPFQQLIWRRDATRFAFILNEVCTETFSPLTALMGYDGELETRRLMLQLFASLDERSGSEPEQTRLREYMQTLAGAAGLAPDDLPKSWSSEQLTTLASRLANSGDRGLVLSEAFFVATLNGSLSDSEEEALEAIAVALEISPQQRLEIQSSVLHSFEINAELRQGFSLTSLLERTRNSTARTIETIVKKNTVAIANEVRETGDLMQLLVKSTSEELSPDEQVRMKEQLQDLCRALPCLALFAAPGGSLLIPVLQRLLPINLLPSSFNEDVSGSGSQERETRDDLPAAKIL